MRILWAMDYSCETHGHLGGGIFSTRLLVKGLKALYHDVMTISPIWPESRLPWYVNRVRTAKRFARGLRRAFEVNPPTVVIAQSHVYPYVIKEAHKAGVPNVLVARDTRYRCPQPPSWTGKGCLTGCARCLGKQALIPYPWFRHHVNMMREWAARSDAQVVPSTFIAQDMREWIPETNPTVIYPPLDTSHHPSSWHPRDVLYLGKGEYKGADIVLAIAEEMQGSDVRFRICGNQDPEHEAKFRRLDNVDYMGFVPQQVAFETAKIVLAPARWTEPAARNVCEAIGIGVPCIISNRGGVPETMGPGGIVVDDLEDIDEWVGHIERLYDEPETWRDYSNAALEHSKMMSLDKMALRLEKVLESVV